MTTRSFLRPFGPTLLSTRSISIVAVIVVSGCRSHLTTQTGADWGGVAAGPAYLGFHVAFSPESTDAFMVSTGDTATAVASRLHTTCSARGFSPSCDTLDVDTVWYDGADGDLSVTEWFEGREYTYDLRVGVRQELRCGLDVTKVER